jgi:D-sedoheptulose 7-phosphate isomerase
MSNSVEVVKQALAEGIRARQEALDKHVSVLVEIGKICGQAIENGNKILLCGNGGSAADAQHLAAELLIRLRPDVTRQTLPAIALAMDTSTLTACGNDLGFEVIFDWQVLPIDFSTHSISSVRVKIMELLLHFLNSCQS